MRSAEATVRSFTSKASIRNNVVVPIGPVLLGVMSLQAGPPPIMRIAVMPADYSIEDDAPEYDVELGGVFPIGEERWRFMDATMYDESLGRTLSPIYRAWLAATNGVQPAGLHGIPGLLFTLFQERPLYGLRPQLPTFDLVTVDTTQRRPRLSEDYVVIAAPPGGLIVVALEESIADVVYYLSDVSMTGPSHALREHMLWALADDIHGFLNRLRRYPDQLDRILANDLD